MFITSLRLLGKIKTNFVEGGVVFAIIGKKKKNRLDYSYDVIHSIFSGLNILISAVGCEAVLWSG